jgi:zona occludens toxin (predicted ATPase)
VFVSLAVIVGILAVSIGYSLWKTRGDASTRGGVDADPDTTHLPTDAPATSIS